MVGSASDSSSIFAPAFVKEKMDQMHLMSVNSAEMGLLEFAANSSLGQLLAPPRPTSLSRLTTTQHVLASSGPTFLCGD